MHKFSYVSHNWLALKSNISVVQKHLPIIKGTVYDLGCGIRPYEDDILSAADTYIGVDWGDTFHTLKADIVADLNKPLPIPDLSTDTVVSFQVLEHLREPQTMLNEAFRVLKRGGRIVLQVPWQWWIHEAPYDFFRYTPYGLKYLFEKAGFVEIVVEPQSGFFTMWILKINYFSTRFICGPRPLKWLIKAAVLPFWYLGQSLAPFLDKLDINWAAETIGYSVTEKKPETS